MNDQDLSVAILALIRSNLRVEFFHAEVMGFAGWTIKTTSEPKDGLWIKEQFTGATLEETVDKAGGA